MLNEIIRKRRSTVLFDSKSVDDRILMELFDAARWAPTSLNLQPWRFIYAKKGGDFYNELLGCLNSGNQVWASNAPVILLSVAEVIMEYKSRKNVYAWHDTAMAYSSLVYQATLNGLFLHPMGGYNSEKTKLVAQIPENYQPVIFAALGYRSNDQDAFPDELVERESKPRTRKPLDEILFYGKFGSNHDL